MTKFKFTLFLLLFYVSGFAQIAWQSNFETAKKLAEKQHKALMVECFHPTCPHCKILNKNLENPALVKFINANYVAYRLDLSKSSEVKILDSYNIYLPSFPMILYFNKGFMNYLDPVENYDELFKQFKAEQNQTCADCDGENGNQKLLKCAFYYRIKNDFDANNRLSERIYKQIVIENQLASLSSWQILKKVTIGVDNNLYKYWVNNLGIAHGFENNTGNEINVIYTILVAELNHARKENTISDEKLAIINDGLIKLGSDKDKILVTTWDVDLVHQLQKNDFEKALRIANQISDKYPNGASQLAFFEIINKNTDSDKMNVFFEAKKAKTLAEMKTAKEKQKFYEKAAQFYAKAGNTKACLDAIKNAKTFGMIDKDWKALKTKCRVN